MNPTTRSWTVALAAIAGLLAAIASAAGVFLHGDLATVAVTTFRGETVETLVNGVYRYNSIAFASEGVGWDVITLFLVVPALAACLPGLWHGSLRARLMAMGILAYFLYQYLEYAVSVAYGPLFLDYVGAFAASLAGIVVLASGIDLADLAARFGTRFPRRSVAGLGILFIVLLGGMWLPLVLRTMTAADAGGALAGGTTLVVQAFDLGLLVPLGIFTAITAWRRHPAGYLLGSVVVVKAVAMALAIVAMIVAEGLATGAWAVPPMVVFGVVAAISAAIGVRLFGGIEPQSKATPRGPGVIATAS